MIKNIYPAATSEPAPAKPSTEERLAIVEAKLHATKIQLRLHSAAIALLGFAVIVNSLTP